METFNQTLGQSLRELRVENRLTQDGLAKLTGLSRASIANMETGRQAISAYQAYQIATALQLESVDTLYPIILDDAEDETMKIFHSPNLNEAQLKQLKAFMAQPVS